jgi:hypothetical protein
MFQSLLSYFNNDSYGSTTEDDEINFEFKKCNKNKFDRNASILQGMYIRDVIKIPNLIDKIFIKEMNMKIEFQTWNICDHDFYSQSSKMKNRIDNYISKKISQLKNNKIYFIDLNFPYHVNIIYIDLKDKNEKKYYLYEPHMPDNNDKKYPKLSILESIFEKNSFVKQEFPNYVLKQDQLPLCYMYTLHFFFNSYHFEYAGYSTKNILNKCYNDDIIINFTEWMLDLCYKNKMIKAEDYYLLTNKICQYNLHYQKYNPNNIFLRSCNPQIILSVFNNHNKININFAKILNLYDSVDFYYLTKFFDSVKKSDMSIYNKHQLLLLSLLMKHYFKVEHNAKIISKKDIDQELLVELIKETDILSLYLNYSFFSSVLELVTDNDDKKMITERFTNNETEIDVEKNKYTDRLVSYMKQINRLSDSKKRDCGVRIGVRRQRDD